MQAYSWFEFIIMPVIQLNVLMRNSNLGSTDKVGSKSYITYLPSSYPKELLNHSQNTNGRGEGARGARGKPEQM